MCKIYLLRINQIHSNLHHAITNNKFELRSTPSLREISTIIPAISSNPTQQPTSTKPAPPSTRKKFAHPLPVTPAPASTAALRHKNFYCTAAVKRGRKKKRGVRPGRKGEQRDVRRWWSRAGATAGLQDAASAHGEAAETLCSGRCAASHVSLAARAAVRAERAEAPRMRPGTPPRHRRHPRRAPREFIKLA